MTRKVLAQAQVCSDRLDPSEPRALVIACKCAGCDGELRCDGIDTIGTRGLLRCTSCGCTYVIEVWR